MTEILVIGVNLGMGWQRVVPFVQFTLIPIKDEVS